MNYIEKALFLSAANIAAQSRDGIILPSHKYKNPLIKDPNYGIIGPEECVKRLHRLNREYNKALIETGYGMSYNALKSLDTIDLRNIFDKTGYDSGYINQEEALPNLDRIVKEIGKTTDGFLFLPCFEEGCVRSNTNRYLYWKILELDTAQEEPFAVIKIQDYICMPQSSSKWLSGTEAILKFRLNDCRTVSVTHANTYYDIYNMLDYKTQLKWSEDDVYLWKQYIIKHSKAAADNIPPEQNGAMLSIHFTAYMYITNKLLQEQKPSRGKRPDKPSQYYTNTQTEYTPQNTPARLTRTIGSAHGKVVITSEKAPKSPSEEYIRHYSVASWKVRATVRHYANGKTVYVRETIHKRHALNSTNGTTPATTLKASKNIKFPKTADKRE